MANVPQGKARAANAVTFIGAMYSFYALYSSGEEAMLYGAIVTFLGWTLYGLISPRFELKDKHSDGLARRRIRAAGLFCLRDQ